jgi:hypothetical protein
VKEALVAYLEGRADDLLALAALEREEPRTMAVRPARKQVR